jgi:hypothetical protein
VTISNHRVSCFYALLTRNSQYGHSIIWSCLSVPLPTNEGVSKSFRTDSLERDLQTVQLSATRCGCIAILWVSLVSFAAITLCVASQREFIVVGFIWLSGGWEFFSSPPRQERLWGPPSLLSSGYEGLLPWGKAAEAWSWPLTSF